MRNITGGRGRGASRLNLGPSYFPPKVSDPAVVRSVLQMLADGASGKDTAALCGVSTRTVSRIRAREAKKHAGEVHRPPRERRKYERPYTKEQRAMKRGRVIR